MSFHIYAGQRLFSSLVLEVLPSLLAHHKVMLHDDGETVPYRVACKSKGYWYVHAHTFSASCTAQPEASVQFNCYGTCRSANACSDLIQEITYAALNKCRCTCWNMLGTSSGPTHEDAHSALDTCRHMLKHAVLLIPAYIWRYTHSSWHVQTHANTRWTFCTNQQMQMNFELSWKPRMQTHAHLLHISQ